MLEQLRAIAGHVPWSVADAEEQHGAICLGDVHVLADVSVRVRAADVLTVDCRLARASEQHHRDTQRHSRSRVGERYRFACPGRWQVGGEHLEQRRPDLDSFADLERATQCSGDAPERACHIGGRLA